MLLAELGLVIGDKMVMVGGESGQGLFNAVQVPSILA